jgi:hypothetical protein
MQTSTNDAAISACGVPGCACRCRITANFSPENEKSSPTLSTGRGNGIVGVPVAAIRSTTGPPG